MKEESGDACDYQKMGTFSCWDSDSHYGSLWLVNGKVITYPFIVNVKKKSKKASVMLSIPKLFCVNQPVLFERERLLVFLFLRRLYTMPATQSTPRIVYTDCKDVPETPTV